MAQREADRGHPFGVRADRSQHMAGGAAPALTGRAAGDRHALEVEADEQCGSIAIRYADVQHVGEPLGASTMHDDVVRHGDQPALQLVTQLAHASLLRFLLLRRQLRSAREPDDPRHVLGARPELSFLPSAEEGGVQRYAVPDEQCADALGPIDLVAADGKKRARRFIHAYAHLAERLNGIRVEYHVLLRTSLGKPRDGLQRPDLVVSPHDAEHARAYSNHLRRRFLRYASLAVDAEHEEV